MTVLGTSLTTSSLISIKMVFLMRLWVLPRGLRLASKQKMPLSIGKKSVVPELPVHCAVSMCLT